MLFPTIETICTWCPWSISCVAPATLLIGKHVKWETEDVGLLCRMCETRRKLRKRKRTVITASSRKVWTADEEVRLTARICKGCKRCCGLCCDCAVDSRANFFSSVLLSSIASLCLDVLSWRYSHHFLSWHVSQSSGNHVNELQWMTLMWVVVSVLWVLEWPVKIHWSCLPSHPVPLHLQRKDKITLALRQSWEEA